jgi:SAM-dependent methyltransferase
MSAQNGIFGEGDAYELFMGRWSRRLAPLLVRFAAVADGDVVLDVGCGTGELTLAIAAVGPAVDVTGIDPETDRAEVPCVLEDGRWRIEIPLPPLAPVEKRPEPG